MLSGASKSQKEAGDAFEALPPVDQELRSTILSSLFCSTPGCHRYLYTPIRQCKAGHNLCIACLDSKSQNCPICTKPILLVHNVPLEAISSQLLVHCSYREKGCPESVPKQCGNLVLHEMQCPYQSHTYTCFALKCPWKGTCAELCAHMIQCHKERVFPGEEKLFKIKKMNNRGDIDITAFMYTSFGCFWTKIVFLKSNKLFFGAVQFLGSESMASKYRYRFEITAAEQDTEKNLIYARSTHKDSIPFIEIFESRDCLCVPLEFAQYLTVNNTLHIKLKLEQIQKPK